MVFLKLIRKFKKKVTLDGLLEKYGLAGKVDILDSKDYGPRLSWKLIRIIKKREGRPEPLFPPGFIQEFTELFVRPAEKRWRRAWGKRAEFKFAISLEAKTLAQIKKEQRQIENHYRLAWSSY